MRPLAATWPIPLAARRGGLRALLLMAAAPDLGVAAGPAFDYRARIGIVAVSRQGICLSIASPDLKKDAILDVVALPPVGSIGRPRTLRARVDQRFDECPGFPDGSTEPRYILQLTEGTVSLGEIAVAVNRPAGEWKTQAKSVTVDLDGDGVDESFRSCASAEGLHLTIWSGEPGKGTRRWHHYHPLGYETEPTCGDADIRATP